jgi:hypothetical protein
MRSIAARFVPNRPKMCSSRSADETDPLSNLQNVVTCYTSFQSGTSATVPFRCAANPAKDGFRATVYFHERHRSKMNLQGCSNSLPRRPKRWINPLAQKDRLNSAAACTRRQSTCSSTENRFVHGNCTRIQNAGMIRSELVVELPMNCRGEDRPGVAPYRRFVIF